MSTITQTKEGLRFQGEQGSTTIVFPPNAQTEDKYIDVGNLPGGGGGVETLTVGAGLLNSGTATNPIIASGDPWLNTAPWTVARLTEDVTLNTTANTAFTVTGLSLQLDTAAAVYEFVLLVVPSPDYHALSSDITLHDIGDDALVLYNAAIGFGGQITDDANNTHGHLYYVGSVSSYGATLPATAAALLRTSGSHTGLIIAAGSFLAIRKLGV